jgi:putative acetyltransferase
MGNHITALRHEQPKRHSRYNRLHVHTPAFDQPQEANLVDASRRNDALTISMVIVYDGGIVGHIAFSPVAITSSTSTIEAIGLGPMAVLPTFQRASIGSRLVETGLEAWKASAMASSW